MRKKTDLNTHENLAGYEKTQDRSLPFDNFHPSLFVNQQLGKAIMDKNLDIDHVDLKIISLLNEDAKTPYTEIAKKVFVSSGTVHVRMRKLEEMGVVKSATLNIDFSKLGYDIAAFLGVYLEKSSLYDNVIDKLKQIPEVVRAYYTTGNYSIFAKIICKDTNHLRVVLNKIQKVEGIDRTETLIVLEESINRPINLFGDD